MHSALCASTLNSNARAVLSSVLASPSALTRAHVACYALLRTDVYECFEVFPEHPVQYKVSLSKGAASGLCNKSAENHPTRGAGTSCVLVAPRLPH